MNQEMDHELYEDFLNLEFPLNSYACENSIYELIQNTINLIESRYTLIKKDFHNFNICRFYVNNKYSDINNIFHKILSIVYEKIYNSQINDTSIDNSFMSLGLVYIYIYRYHIKIILYIDMSNNNERLWIEFVSNCFEDDPYFEYIKKICYDLAITMEDLYDGPLII